MKDLIRDIILINEMKFLILFCIHVRLIGCQLNKEVDDFQKKKHGSER